MQSNSRAGTFRPPGVVRVLVASIIVSGLLAGCSGDNSGDLLAIVERGEFGLRSVSPSASDVVLSIGQDTTLTANGSFRDGGLKKLDDAVWRSLDSSVATVDANGIVTAVAEGSTKIVLVFRDQSAESMITVTEASLETIMVTPTSLELNECQSAVVSASGAYSDGTRHAMPISALLTVSDNLVVSASLWADTTRTDVNEETTNEEIEGDDPPIGTTRIQLQSHDAGASDLTISVGELSTILPIVSLDNLTEIDIGDAVVNLQPGDSIDLSATALYDDGSTADISAVGQWTLTAEDGTDLGTGFLVLDSEPDHEPDTDPDAETESAFAALFKSEDNVAPVLRSSGSGRAILEFTCGGLTQTAQVIIESPPVLESISMDVSDALLLVTGRTATIEAQAMLSDGTTGEFEEKLVWELADEDSGFSLSMDSGNSVVVTVADDSLIEASVELYVTSGGVTESATLTANAGVADSLKAVNLQYVDDAGELIVLNQGRVHTVTAGESLALEVLGIYLSGRTDIPESVQWGNSTPAIATIDQDGVVQALSAGSTFISVFAEGIQLYLPLMVLDPIIEPESEAEDDQES